MIKKITVIFGVYRNEDLCGNNQKFEFLQDSQQYFGIYTGYSIVNLDIFIVRFWNLEYSIGIRNRCRNGVYF